MVQKRVAVVVLGAWLVGLAACGGAAKEPMHPDNDDSATLRDGGAPADPSAPPAAAPAPK